MKQRPISLDGLRGLGACTVAFIWHYQHFAPTNGSPFDHVLSILYKHGWLAVELFFMISGFVIAYNYYHRISNHELTFKSYIFKRLKHLSPLALLTLIVVTLEELAYIHITGSTFIYSNFDLYHFILNLFCIQSGWFANDFSFNGPAWCISIEIFCYIIYYFITYWSHNRPAKYCILCTLIAILGIVAYYNHWTYPFASKDYMARGYICFFIGCILAHLYELVSFKTSTILTITFSAFGILLGVYTDLLKNYLPLYLMLITFPLLIWISINLNIFKRILEFQPLQLLGKLSFSIYLWHFPIQCFISLIDKGFKLNINYSTHYIFFMYVIITLLVSFLSYTFIEQKIKHIALPHLSA